MTRTPETRPVEPAAERLQRIFSRHQDELLGTLYYLVGNIEDARDALQETFVKCWRRLDGIDQIENLRAWVFRIAVNAGRDVRSTAWRRRRRSLDNEGATVVASDKGPEVDAVRSEELDLIRRAIRQLRPEEQEVFLLRQNGSLTYDQIAQSIDIPVGTVKTRMRLALSKLRASLAER